MPKIETIICDCCPAVKKDANHWFKVRIGEGFHVYPWEYLGEGASDDSIPTLLLCGDACVTKALAEYLSELKRKQDLSARAETRRA